MLPKTLILCGNGGIYKILREFIIVSPDEFSVFAVKLGILNVLSGLGILCIDYGGIAEFQLVKVSISVGSVSVKSATT